MRRKLSGSVLALLFGACAMAQLPTGKGLAPVRIILVGDSTVAPRNGWGPGFCADVDPAVTCVNLAKNGRSTSSYRAEGSWAAVMDMLKSNAAFSATYVLIQFGHNDQPGKPGRSTDLATEFPANLRQYVIDLKSVGAKPVLVTSLTRRTFQAGRLKNDLVPWAEATKKVAAEENVPVLDLNSESAAAVQKMGPVEANTLAMAPPLRRWRQALTLATLRLRRRRRRNRPRPAPGRIAPSSQRGTLRRSSITPISEKRAPRYLAG